MSDLISKIRAAQIYAGENVVRNHLKEIGIIKEGEYNTDENSTDEKIILTISDGIAHLNEERIKNMEAPISLHDDELYFFCGFIKKRLL